MRRKILRYISFCLGVSLFLASQYFLANPPKTGSFLKNTFGPPGHFIASFRQEIVPYGVAFGMMIHLLSGFIVCCALGKPRFLPGLERLETPPDPPVVFSNRSNQKTTFRRIAWGAAIVTLIAQALSICQLFPQEPPNTAAIYWIIAILLTFISFTFWDIIRRTTVPNPFFNKTELWSVILLTLFLIVLLGHDAGNVRWSGTPDESHFFLFAKLIAQHGVTDRFILAENGVFDYHPVLSSYYQAIWMRLLGLNAWGWKLSGIISLGFSAPFLYILTRFLFNRRAGYAAILLFATSRLTITFSHLGYNNIQILPVLIISLGLLTLAYQKKSLSGYFLAGCVTGLGFYSYYPARIVPIIILLFGFGIRAFRFKNRQYLLTIAALMGFLLVISPLLLHPAQMATNMLQQTAVTKGEKIQPDDIHNVVSRFFTSLKWLQQIADHLFLSLFHGVWYKYPSHFNINPIMEPISGLLMVTGFWISIREMLSRNPRWFLFPAYLISALLAGAISPYDRPPLTRLLFLVPISVLFMVFTCESFMHSEIFGTCKHWKRISVTFLICISCFWNYRGIRDQVYVQMNGYGEGTTTEFIRIARSLPVTCQLIYLQKLPTYMECVDMVADEFELGYRTKYFRSLDENALRELRVISPPFAIFCDLEKIDTGRVKELLDYRFTGLQPLSTSPGKNWNLTYFYATD